MYAAVVELDPLADPVRPGAEDHDRLALPALQLVARGALPARVVVGRSRRELRGAGVNGPERAFAGERRLRVQGKGTQLAQKPRVDRCELVDLIDVDPAPEELEEHLEAIGPRDANALEQLVGIGHGAHGVWLAHGGGAYP